MASCRNRWAEDFELFWKKQLVKIWTWAKRVGIRIWARPVQLFTTGCARVCWVSELRADAGRTVSIVKIVCVSLSPRVEKPKLKEGNKSFGPEPRESSVFRDSYACFTFYVSVCLTHPYIRIKYISHIRRLWLCYKTDFSVLEFFDFITDLEPG